MADETLRRSGGLSLAVAGSRVLGLVRESVFAAAFGAGALADAYQVAFRVPNLLRDLFAEGALSAAFIPTFAKVRAEHGDARAWALGNAVLAWLLALTGLLTVAGIVWAEPVVTAMTAGMAGDAEKLRLAVISTQLMMPLLTLVSVGALWMGMANARGQFTVPALAPAAFNVVNIVAGAILLGFGIADERALWWWSAATLGAGLVQSAMQIPVLWRLGYRPGLPLVGALTDPGVARVARLMAPAALGVAAVQVNVFFNTQFASALGDGPVAQLSYAFRVFFLPLGVFSVALATVTTTRVSEDAARKDHAAIAAAAGESAAAVWMLMLASMVGLVVLAEPIVQVLFQRGAFGPAQTQATAMVLRAYALGLVPYGLVKIYAPVFYSLDRARVPLIASASAVALNLTFNALTYRWLGAPGLALGTVLAALVNATLLRVLLVRALPAPPTAPRLARRMLALLVAASTLAVIAAVSWWGPTSLWPALGERNASAAVLLVVATTAGGLAYLAVLSALDHPGATALLELPARAWARLRRRPKPDTT